MNCWNMNVVLLLLMLPSTACGGNTRPTRSGRTPHTATENAPITRQPIVLEVEDDVLRLIDEGKVSEAQALAKRSKASGNQLLRLEGFLYHAVGQADLAVSALSKAQVADPSDPTVSILLAEGYCWKKNFGEAKRLLDQVPDTAIAQMPRPWELSFHKARVLGWIGQLDAAEAQYTKTHNLPNAPKRVLTRCQIGIAEITAWRKRYSQALQIIELVLTETPGDVDAILVKGQAQEWQGRYKEARVTYTQALQANPEDARLRSRLEGLSWVK